MSTGYTYNIKDGISFDTFVMNCARAFGACITLRDEKCGGEVIPERFTVDNHYKNRMTEILKEIHKLTGLTDEELEQLASKEFIDSETNRINSLNEISNQKKSYEDMLNKVIKWNPPTKEHEGLKSFMIEQINDSIEFDCQTTYYDKPTTRLTGKQWKSKEVERLQTDYAFYMSEHQKEVERVEKKNQWIQQLRDSLKVQQ